MESQLKKLAFLLFGDAFTFVFKRFLYAGLAMGLQQSHTPLCGNHLACRTGDALSRLKIEPEMASVWAFLVRLVK